MNHITHEKSMLITTDDWTETAQNQGTPVLEYGIRISSPEEPSFQRKRWIGHKGFLLHFLPVFVKIKLQYTPVRQEID